jgi:hypothetical protein
VSLAGHDAKPHGQLLHHEQDRHQHDLQQQEPVAPLGAALRCRNDAAGIRVGQHDHEAGAGHGSEMTPVENAHARDGIGCGHGGFTYAGRPQHALVGIDLQYLERKLC